jgi:hypothetical protein
MFFARTFLRKTEEKNAFFESKSCYFVTKQLITTLVTFRSEKNWRISPFIFPNFASFPAKNKQ